MIRGLHGMIYSSDVERSRAFVRDKLKLPHTDVGGGWLIFDLPEGDLGFHPSEHPDGAGEHDVSFYCDDIKGTVADLRARGVEFESDPEDHGYGWVTHFAIPGGIRVQLYEPKYQKGTARAKAQAAVNKVKEVAGQAAGKAKVAAEQAAGKAKVAAGQAADKAKLAAGKAKAAVQRAAAKAKAEVKKRGSGSGKPGRR